MYRETGERGIYTKSGVRQTEIESRLNLTGQNVHGSRRFHVEAAEEKTVIESTCCDGRKHVTCLFTDNLEMLKLSSR